MRILSLSDHIHAEQFRRTVVRFVFRVAAERGDRLAVGRAHRADGRGRTPPAPSTTGSPPAKWRVRPVAEFPGDVRSHRRRVQNGRRLRSVHYCSSRGDHDHSSHLSSPPPTFAPPTAATAAPAAATPTTATATPAHSPATATADPSPAVAPAPRSTPATPTAPYSRTAAAAAALGPVAHSLRLSLSTLSWRVAAAPAARFTARGSRRHRVRVRTNVGSRAGGHVAQATPSTTAATTSPPSSPPTTAATTRRRRRQSPATPSTTTVSASVSAAATVGVAANGHVSDV